jgi:hypothetical protein
MVVHVTKCECETFLPGALDAMKPSDPAALGQGAPCHAGCRSMGKVATAVFLVAECSAASCCVHCHAAGGVFFLSRGACRDGSQDGAIYVVELTQSYAAAAVPPTMTAAVTQMSRPPARTVMLMATMMCVGVDGEWRVVTNLRFRQRMEVWICFSRTTLTQDDADICLLGILPSYMAAA